MDCLFLATGHAHLLHEARWQNNSSMPRWPEPYLHKQSAQLFPKEKQLHLIFLYTILLVLLKAKPRNLARALQALIRGLSLYT